MSMRGGEGTGSKWTRDEWGDEWEMIRDDGRGGRGYVSVGRGEGWWD